MWLEIVAVKSHQNVLCTSIVGRCISVAFAMVRVRTADRANPFFGRTNQQAQFLASPRTNFAKSSHKCCATQICRLMTQLNLLTFDVKMSKRDKAVADHYDESFLSLCVFSQAPRVYLWEWKSTLSYAITSEKCCNVDMALSRLQTCP